MAARLHLPQDKVERKKAEIWAIIKGPDRELSDELYAQTIRLINTPAALLATAALDESMRLRRRLNRHIILGRAIDVATVGAIIAALVLWSYWPLLLALGLELLWYLFISARQTAINVALGATTEVFSEMLHNDSEFRSRAKETISREYGAQAAQGLEDFISGE